jgi:hypothetical protein
LAANEKGRAILAEVRRRGGFPVVTKPADAPSDAEQTALGARLDGLFSLATERRGAASAMMKKSPLIL